MGNLLDTFQGSAGVITGHTSDSGHTWVPSGTPITIDGSGNAYNPYPVTGHAYYAASSYSPSSLNYVAEVTFGAGFRQPGINAGLLMRAEITSLTITQQYEIFIVEGSPDQLLVRYSSYTGTITSPPSTQYSLPGSPANLASQIATGDRLAATISGGFEAVVITVYHNETQIFQATDTNSFSIVNAWSPGLLLYSGSALSSTAVISKIQSGLSYPFPTAYPAALLTAM